ncbi:MAG: zinc ribbon domain-containing protein [Proteobacteria bacterium]|nr:zinc ribbon domain-containing protein [Pseudomonadota bacterium]
MLCPKCGATIEADSRFCSDCGHQSTPQMVAASPVGTASQGPSADVSSPVAPPRFASAAVSAPNPPEWKVDHGSPPPTQSQALRDSWSGVRPSSPLAPPPPVGAGSRLLAVLMMLLVAAAFIFKIAIVIFASGHGRHHSSAPPRLAALERCRTAVVAHVA